MTYFEDRNLRINCQPGVETVNLTNIAALLIAKHFNSKSVSCIALVLGRHLFQVEEQLSVAMHLICGGSTPKHKDKALIINLDEAQGCVSDSDTVTLGLTIHGLQALSIQCGWRIFLTVTGISAPVVQRILDKSSHRALAISLPMLENRHTIAIVQRLFQQPTDTVMLKIAFALACVGGVPRCLQAFLATVATHMSVVQLDHQRLGRDAVLANIWHQLNTASVYDICVLLRTSANANYPMPERAGLSLTASELSHVISLAVSGCPVELSQLTKHNLSPERLELYCHFMQLTEEPGKVVIRLPTIVLFNLLRFSHMSMNLELPLSSGFRGMTSTTCTQTQNETETTAIDFLMHRLRALRMSKQTSDASVTLAELGLFFRSGPSSVSLPFEFYVRALDNQHAGPKLRALIDGIQASYQIHRDVLSGKPAPCQPWFAPCAAFLNAKSAPSADAFVVFENFVLFLQEKQSVLSRRDYWQGKARCVANGQEILDEYTKAVAGTGLTSEQFGFVYVTDQTVSEEVLALLPDNCCVVDFPRHQTLLGPVCAQLRAFAVAEDSARAGSEECERVMSVQIPVAMISADPDTRLSFVRGRESVAARAVPDPIVAVPIPAAHISGALIETAAPVNGAARKSGFQLLRPELPLLPGSRKGVAAARGRGTLVSDNGTVFGNRGALAFASSRHQIGQAVATRVRAAAAAAATHAHAHVRNTTDLAGGGHVGPTLTPRPAGPAASLPPNTRAVKQRHTLHLRSPNRRGSDGGGRGHGI
eukprot:m.140721 g.140721  ORF g.140721 m.140721 type:complete len:763 (+) comp14954_c1_seq1:119-2407(+)